jgi:predicted RNase H-like nuclease (RuvC/YqgF family)
MSEALLITLIGAAVIIVPLLISFRTTSFIEMKGVVSELKELIEKYEKDLTKIQTERKQEQLDYQKKVTELQTIIGAMDSDIILLKQAAENKDKRIDSLERQIDNYERWMTSAIAEIKRLGGTPPEWNKN